jgi:Transposase DDE domain group 1
MRATQGTSPTMSDATPFLSGLSPLCGKPLTTSMDAGNLSANGGLVVLREVAERLGLAEVIARPIPDTRNPSHVRHSYADMITARMMMIAAGHEDCDDIDALKADPALKIACGRTPESSADLMSQPTLSRLENSAGVATLYRIGRRLIDFFCESYSVPPRQIVLDIDDTDDLVHGGQQLALFNTHAGGHCFQPIHIFEGNSGKPILSLLRPGKRPSVAEGARVLLHVIRTIRRHWPKVRILVRADSHYCGPHMLAVLRHFACDYILGLSINAKLDAIAGPWREQCRTQRSSARSVVRRFHTFRHRAGSWSREEKVIARIEATEMGEDARFVITSLPGRSKHLYEQVYCARGRMENMIKDMKLYTRSDKTACHRWQANQFRLFLHMGAYWLLHSLRLAAPRKSRWRTATFATIRLAFVKIACRIEELKTKIKLSFATHLAHADDLCVMTARLSALGP